MDTLCRVGAVAVECIGRDETVDIGAGLSRGTDGEKVQEYKVAKQTYHMEHFMSINLRLGSIYSTSCTGFSHKQRVPRSR